MLLAMLAPLVTGCVDPAAFGAVPNDLDDDAPAFQRAIDRAIELHQDVCVGPGVWSLERPAGRPGSLTITGGPIAIRGAGDATVLRMAGAGHQRAWRAIYVREARGVAIRDLAIDGRSATDTEEQTHLIELGPDTRDAVIRNVVLGPMREPGQRVGEGIGGDCIRLLGEPGHEVADVVIADSRLLDCDRSGIAVQRAVRDLTVVRTTISGAGDTAIDFEPTGRGAIDDVAIVDVTVRRPDGAQSASAITLAGTDDDGAHRLLVQGSTLEGGISLLNVDDAIVADSAITAARANAAPTITVLRRASGIRLVNNTIARLASSGPGFALRIAHNNGSQPRGIVVEGNTIVQGTAHAIVGAVSAGGLELRRNAIEYTADDLGPAVVQVNADVADVTGIVVEDNGVRGTPSALVTASLRDGRKLAGVSVRGNRAPNIAALRCNAVAAAFAPVELDGPLPPNTGCAGVALRIRPTAR